MSDLIKRLRDCMPPTVEDAEMCEEAADVLDKLHLKAREARISLEHGELDDAKEALNDILRASP